MKRFVLVLISAFLLHNCSMIKKEDSSISTTAVKFVESAGKIEMVINSKGDWVTLKSSGTASVLLDDNNALEQAMNVATLRAKANLIEFIETELKSSKSVETITKSLMDDSEERIAEIATNVSEKINSESKGILRGVYVIERKISEDRKYVIVTIMADKKIFEAIKRFK